MLVCDEANPRARAYRDELLRRMPEGVSDDMVVVLGGDGFLLQTVGRLGLERPLLGLNAGTLGFLLNRVDNWDAVADRLRRRDWFIADFPLLDAQIELDDGRRVHERALNDVYLERASGQTARLEVSVDGTVVVERLVADGLVVATPLGSTAYAFSAGGPPCHPTLSALCVAPICPHLPKLPPFVHPTSATVRVRVFQGERRPVRAVADGRQIDGIRHVRLGMSDATLRLAYFTGHDFTAQMIRKILHP